MLGSQPSRGLFECSVLVLYRSKWLRLSVLVFIFYFFWKTKPNVLLPQNGDLCVDFVRVTSGLCARGPCGLFLFFFYFLIGGNKVSELPDRDAQMRLVWWTV